ncbi:MAG TPA: MFS transporter [Pyrinomonadaceae bacterium]|nr:MFS transporter [Pyrinomonadaceae bacterium]
MSKNILPPSTSTNPSAAEKLKVREKIGFAFGDAGLGLTNQFILSFYLIYLTDVASIPAASAGTLFLVARLFNGLNDPLTGYFMDNYPLRTSWGKFRSWLLVATIPASVFVVLMFVIPNTSITGKLIYLYAVVLIFDLITDFISTPLGSLMSNVTQNTQERSSIASFRGIATAIVAILVPVLTLSLKDRFGTPKTGWLFTALVFAFLGAVCLLICFKSVKERVVPKAEDATYTFREGLRIVMQNRPILILSIANVFLISYFSIAFAVRIFYFKYNMGNENLLAPIMGIGVLAIFAGMVVSPLLAKRVGKRLTALAGGTILCAMHVALYFVPATSLVPVVCVLVGVGIGTGLLSIMILSLVPDTVEYSEWKTGHRAEAIINSVNTFIFKLGGAVGVAIPGWILAATGYVPNAKQSAGALKGILMSMSIIPAIFVFLTIVALFFYPFDEDQYAQAISEIAQRKALPAG